MRKKVSAVFGWVVERNIGHDRKVIVYLNDKRPWYQGELNEAQVYTDYESARSLAFWQLGTVREVEVRDGVIRLVQERWTGTFG